MCATPATEPIKSVLSDAKEFNEAQAETFYRQTESNFKGYPAVRLRKYDGLTRQGNTIPVDFERRWPLAYVSDGSAILCEKLVDAIPYSMTNTHQILNQFLRNRDGYQALMTIMKRWTPRLGQLPPKMEPAWTVGMTSMEHANTLQTCIKRQENFGRTHGDFEIISSMAQRAMVSLAKTLCLAVANVVQNVVNVVNVVSTTTRSSLVVLAIELPCQRLQRVSVNGFHFHFIRSLPNSIVLICLPIKFTERLAFSLLRQPRLPCLRISLRPENDDKTVHDPFGQQCLHRHV
jgi:hypothetical protein